MNKENFTNKNEGAQEKKSNILEFPRKPKAEMTAESEKSVVDFKEGNQKELSGLEKKAVADGLEIDPSDQQEIQEINQEADEVKAEFIAEIGDKKNLQEQQPDNKPVSLSEKRKEKTDNYDFFTDVTGSYDKYNEENPKKVQELRNAITTDEIAEEIRHWKEYCQNQVENHDAKEFEQFLKLMSGEKLQEFAIKALVTLKIKREKPKEPISMENFFKAFPEIKDLE